MCMRSLAEGWYKNVKKKMNLVYSEVLAIIHHPTENWHGEAERTICLKDDKNLFQEMPK